MVVSLFTVMSTLVELDRELWLRWPAESWVVSNMGRVWSIKYKRLLHPTLKSKYWSVQKAYIHRMVASLFVSGQTTTECFVDHINGNRNDNRAENLRWCTRQQNRFNAHHENCHGYTGVRQRRNGAFAWQLQESLTGILHGGTCATAREAGLAYARKAEQLHGSHLASHIAALLREAREDEPMRSNE